MKKGTMIIVGLLAIILLMGSFILGTMNGKDDSSGKDKNLFDKLKDISIDDENKSDEEGDCPKDWQFYKQDVLGIAFCYPEEKWGKANTGYLKNITDLSVIASDYKEQNVHYDKYLKIGFDVNSDKKRSPVIKIFNDEYPGEHYNNVQTHKLGYRDNIPTLKQTGDICQYKINFTKKWANQGSENEVYAACDDGIKTSLVERKDYFNFKNSETGEIIGQKYQYFLNLFAYKKLENGYFNNALIVYDVDNTSQIKNRLETFQVFFNLDHSYKANERVTLSSKEFQQRKTDFQKFVKSIKIFKPVKEDLSKYKAVGMDDNTNVIAKYYWFLTNKKFVDAYNLKQTNQSLDDFTAQYKDIHYAQPYDFVNEGDNKYVFYVKYQDRNNIEEKYQAKVEIVNGKIKTNLAQKILTDKVKYGNNLVAYAVMRGNKNYVILEKDGREIIVDQGDAKYDKDYENMGGVKFFGNLRFSPQGNYLIYSSGGYEWVFSMVYDIGQEKVVKKLSSGDGTWFTDDEKHIYICGINEMVGSRTGIVQSVPDFQTVFDVYGDDGDFKQYSESEKYSTIECEYDKFKKVIRFTLLDYYKELPNKISEYTVQ